MHSQTSQLILVWIAKNGVVRTCECNWFTGLRSPQSREGPSPSHSAILLHCTSLQLLPVVILQITQMPQSSFKNLYKIKLFFCFFKVTSCQEYQAKESSRSPNKSFWHQLGWPKRHTLIYWIWFDLRLQTQITDSNVLLLTVTHYTWLVYLNV